MRTALFTLVMSAAFATPALACPVCFGAADSLQVKGMQMGILALLGVTTVVLGAFGGFFLYLRRRLRLAELMDDAPAIQQRAHGGSY